MEVVVLTTITDGANVRRRWRYYDSVGTGAYFTFVSDRSGSGDEIHVVVVDEDGDVRRTWFSFRDI